MTSVRCPTRGRRSSGWPPGISSASSSSLSDDVAPGCMAPVAPSSRGPTTGCFRYVLLGRPLWQPYIGAFGCARPGGGGFRGRLTRFTAALVLAVHPAEPVCQPVCRRLEFRVLVD